MAKGKDVIKGKILSSYEKGLLEGAFESKADKIEKENILRAKLRQVLGLSIDMETPAGTSVNVDVMTLLALESVSEAIRKPSTSKLKDIAAILGELKDSNSEVVVSIVDKGLEGLSVK